MKKLFLFLLACACGGIWWFHSVHPLPWVEKLVALAKPTSAAPPRNAAAPGAAPSATKASEGAPPTPVLTSLVETRDVSIYLNGLGNVQGFNTVTIRSRIDGHLEKVVFSEGQEVKAGELLAQIDPRPYQAALDQALARRKQNEALLTNARQDLARDLALLAENAGTAQKADSQKALVSQLESSLKADDAAIEAANVQLGYATIRSPISGRAGIRLVDEGNVVRAQDANGIVVITQMQPVSVLFTLTEQNLHAIRTAAEKGPLQAVALGRDNSSLIAEGTLSVIDNQIDSTTGTIRLKATFANEALQLWPGQFVNVRLRVEVRKGATVVPAQVVQYGPQGTYAFVVSPENTAEMRPLKLNRVEDGLALIDSGLQPGERVVVDGQYRLQPGAKMRPGEGGKGDAESRKRMAESGNSKPRP